MNIQARYGIITGLLMANWPFVSYYAGMGMQDNPMVVQLVPYIILLVFLVAAILKHRKDIGYLDIREGMRTGLGISGLAGILYSIGRYIYIKYVDSYEVAVQAESYRRQLEGRGMNQSRIEDEVASFTSTYPFHNSLTMVAMTLIMGGILSLLIALVLKRRNTATQA